MKLTVSLLVVLAIIGCVYGSSSGEDVDKHKQHAEKWKKKKECMKQTQDLRGCCELPKPKEDLRTHPECSKHLEGIENKQKKEKWEAIICFHDCLFVAKGLVDESNKEVKWDAVKTHVADFFGQSEAFTDVTEKSLEVCENKFNQFKEQRANFKAKHPNNDEKKCNWLPTAAIKCLLGYTVRNCPESAWKGTDECNAIKANVTATDECMKW